MGSVNGKALRPWKDVRFISPYQEIKQTRIFSSALIALELRSMEIAEFAIKMFLASPVTHLASQDEGEKGLFQPQQPRGKTLGGAARECL